MAMLTPQSIEEYARGQRSTVDLSLTPDELRRLYALLELLDQRRPALYAVLDVLDQQRSLLDYCQVRTLFDGLRADAAVAGVVRF